MQRTWCSWTGRPPNLIPCHDPVNNIVYAAHCSNVVMNMARGKVIYRNGEFLTLDYEKIKRRCGACAPPPLRLRSCAYPLTQYVKGCATLLSSENKSTFFGGAAVLAYTYIYSIVKLIGALYKIPLGNILGDEGFATSTMPMSSTTCC